jgi:hypothetical protein
VHPRDQLQEHSLSVAPTQWINSKVLLIVIWEVGLQKHANTSRTYLVPARTKPQRLKKLSNNPFAPSCLLACLSIRPPGRPHGTAWLALTDFRGIIYYFQSSVEKIQFFLIGQE